MMPTSVLSRAAAAAAAGLLLTACERDEGSSARAEAARAAASSVVVHMTGLMMMVPHNNTMHVLMPRETDHVAVLGFGIDPGNADAGRLCMTGPVFPDTLVTKIGICYVKLDEWSLRPLGTGGQLTPPESELPEGLLNVSELSGGEHKVQFPVDRTRTRAQVAFLSGWASPNHCSRASWRFTAHPHPEDSVEHQQRRDLVNVLRWVIRSPDNLSLTFVGTDDTITVPLPQAPPSGRIELVMAHVPTSDLGDLPFLRRVTEPHNPTNVAQHFAAYYDLLGAHGEIGSADRRRLPRDAVRNAPCSLAITSGASGILPIAAAAAVGTYACMLATGEGG